MEIKCGSFNYSAYDSSPDTDNFWEKSLVLLVTLVTSVVALDAWEHFLNAIGM
jgi:hypothetical protein